MLSHQWKIIPGPKMNSNTKESSGISLPPEKLWAVFIAVRSHHFRCHKPNSSLQPADCHICFLVINSCTESAPRGVWMRHLLWFIFSDTVKSGALSRTKEQMATSGLSDYTVGRQFRNRVLNFLLSQVKIISGCYIGKLLCARGLGLPFHCSAILLVICSNHKSGHSIQSEPVLYG